MNSDSPRVVLDVLTARIESADLRTQYEVRTQSVIGEFVVEFIEPLDRIQCFEIFGRFYSGIWKCVNGTAVNLSPEVAEAEAIQLLQRGYEGHGGRGIDVAVQDAVHDPIEGLSKVLLHLRDTVVAEELRKLRNWVFATTGCTLSQKVNIEIAREALRRSTQFTGGTMGSFSDGSLSRDWRIVVEHYLSIRAESTRVGVTNPSDY